MAISRNLADRNQLLKLEPARDVVVNHRTMEAVSRDPWLRLDQKDGFAKHRWVRIRYAASYFDDPVRPLIRFVTAEGREYIQVMNGPVAGRGEWIGRIPTGTKTVFVSPVSGIGRFHFSIEKIEKITRGFLLRRGIKYDKRALMQSIGARVINAEEEHWDTLRFAATATPLQKYDNWYRRNYRPLDLSGLDRPRSDWTKASIIRLLVSVQDDIAAFTRTLRSLKGQAFPRWSLSAIASSKIPSKVENLLRKEMDTDRRIEISDETESFQRLSQGWDSREFVGLIDPGDSLPEHALAVVAETIARLPQACVIYGDEDASMSDGTLHSPILKPDWSPSFNKGARYMGRLSLVQKAQLDALSLKSPLDLFANEARIFDRIATSLEVSAVHHIRRIIYRRSTKSEVSSGADQVRVRAPALIGDGPRVSLIIPTRDRADLLDQCLTSLYRHTDYQNLEIILVDNGTKQADAKSLLRRCRERPDHLVIERPGPFNYSLLCNDGAASATGEVFVFLNNDIVFFEDGWLNHLVAWASQDDVGVTGAKLLFPDRTIEHAGVVIGHGGLAGHIYHREAVASAGYMRQLALTREVSASTGACLAIEKRKFEAVGGFDSVNLPIDLNDIDLCLKLRETGLRNIWTPDAVMYHLQSASRGFPVRPSRTYRKERTYFRMRWMHVIRDDPYFHPALSLFSHKLALA